MKISKVDKINNIFSFSFFKWDSINHHTFDDKNGNTQNFDGSFEKSNVLFAENGNGKSNLIKIFKSLNSQDIELKKHRDYPSEKQELKLILSDNSEINFMDSKWTTNKLKDKFIIFDKYFINEFVHSVGPDYNDTPQRQQQRGRNIIYLGNFAKYNEEIDRINVLKNNTLERNNNFIQIEQSKIEPLLKSNDISLDKLNKEKDMIRRLDKNNLQNKKEELNKKKIEYNKIKNAINDKEKINQLLLLSEIRIAFSLKIQIIIQKESKEIEIKPDEIFSFTILRGLRKTLHKIAHKKDFVKAGLSLLNDSMNSCPFCEQKIKNGDYIQIIKDYQEIFNKTFAEEEKNVRVLLNKYKTILEEIRDIQVPYQNKSKLYQAKPFIVIEDELPDLVIPDNDKIIIKNELRLVLEKEKKILDKTEGLEIEQIKKIINTANELITKYNTSIKKINEKIKQIRKDATEGKLNGKKEDMEKKISKLNEEIFFIENKEYLEEYFKALEKSKNNAEVIKSLERIFQSLKNKIIEEFNKFVTEYFDLIQSFIKEICPSMDIFQIEGETRYDRRSQESAQCGFFIKYNGEDCTKSLSEGEKQVIALSFFFAQLRKENDKNKVIVFDDPITSFDAGKRKSTAEVIHMETNDFEQLFVFTCDPLFREFCLKQIDNRNFYYIFKTKGASSIHYASKNRETIYDCFENQFKDIERYNGYNENVVIFGQKLRFCLETKIKEDYFGYSQDNFSNMIEKVAGKGESKFNKLIKNKGVILQIYNYCNTGGLAHYPKDGSTSWNELKDKINQYLELDL